MKTKQTLTIYGIEPTSQWWAALNNCFTKLVMKLIPTVVVTENHTTYLKLT